MGSGSRIVGLTLALAASAPSAARANEATAIVGGTLTGALLGPTVLGIFRLRSPWLYPASMAIGGGLGALAGYGVAQSTDDPAAGAALLASGFLLVVPALVLSLDALRYRPSEAAREDRAPTHDAAPPPLPHPLDPERAKPPPAHAASALGSPVWVTVLTAQWQ
jgi:hypothetical protein